MSQRRHDRRAAMSKRHADALAIAAGACNPSGIASSIIDACQEIRRQPDYRMYHCLHICQHIFGSVPGFASGNNCVQLF